MKNTVNFLSLVIIMVLFSCSSEPIIDSQTSLQSVASKAASNKYTAPVEDNLANVVGTSTLHRNKNGITVNFKTDGLIPGNAYTLWFVVFGDAPGPPSSRARTSDWPGSSRSTSLPPASPRKCTPRPGCAT